MYFLLQLGGAMTISEHLHINVLRQELLPNMLSLGADLTVHSKVPAASPQGKLCRGRL